MEVWGGGIAASGISANLFLRVFRNLQIQALSGTNALSHKTQAEGDERVTDEDGEDRGWTTRPYGPFSPSSPAHQHGKPAALIASLIFR